MLGSLRSLTPFGWSVAVIAVLSLIATLLKARQQHALTQQESRRPNMADPKPGTYPLRIGTNAEILNGSDRIFAAVYSRWNDARDNGEAYRSQDGEVVIRDASGSRISGSFSFVAFELCPDGPAVLCPGDPPSSPPPGARLIEVSGTFEARPFKQGQSTLPASGSGSG